MTDQAPGQPLSDLVLGRQIISGIPMLSYHGEMKDMYRGLQSAR
jgi:hypothetical protein